MEIEVSIVVMFYVEGLLTGEAPKGAFWVL